MQHRASYNKTNFYIVVMNFSSFIYALIVKLSKLDTALKPPQLT